MGNSFLLQFHSSLVMAPKRVAMLNLLLKKKFASLNCNHVLALLSSSLLFLSSSYFCCLLFICDIYYVLYTYEYGGHTHAYIKRCAKDKLQARRNDRRNNVNWNFAIEKAEWAAKIKDKSKHTLAHNLQERMGEEREREKETRKIDEREMMRRNVRRDHIISKFMH